MEFPKIYLYRQVVQAKLFIDNNYSENINLDIVADKAFFSKYHFIRLFTKMYGRTPHQYLKYVRIEKAKILLQMELKIADVCFAVGFNSVSSFTGLFKQITGETPSDYQINQIKRKHDIDKTPLKFIPNCFAEKNGWKKLAILKK